MVDLGHMPRLRSQKEYEWNAGPDYGTSSHMPQLRDHREEDLDAGSASGYATCRMPELRELVKLRTGKRVVRHTQRRQLVKILQDDDHAAGGSRFLELPAEMRNRVYRELLTLGHHNSSIFAMSDEDDVEDEVCDEIYDSEDDIQAETEDAPPFFCFPAILRTNSQVSSHILTWPARFSNGTC